MKINCKFNYSAQLVDFVKDKINTLNEQHKRIGLIVLAAFSCLAMGYLLYRWFKPQKIAPIDSAESPKSIPSLAPKIQSLASKEENNGLDQIEPEGDLRKSQPLQVQNKGEEINEKFLDDYSHRLYMLDNRATDYAHRLYMHDNLAEAVLQYEKLVQKEPNNAHVFFGYAKTLEKLKRLDEAAEQYKKALQLNPFDALNFRDCQRLFKLLGREKELEPIEQGLWDGYKTALAQKPNDVQLLHEYTHQLYMHDNLAEAALQYEKLVQKEPNNAHVLFGYAKTLEKLKRLDEAAEQYRKALQLNPFDALNFRDCQRLFKQLGREKELEPIEQGLWDGYKTALAQKPNDVQLLQEYTHQLYMHDNLAEAALQYEKLVQKKPNNAHVFFGYAKTLEKLKRLDEAAEQYKKAAQLDPSNSLNYFNDCERLFKQLGREEELEPIEQKFFAYYEAQLNG